MRFIAVGLILLLLLSSNPPQSDGPPRPVEAMAQDPGGNDTTVYPFDSEFLDYKEYDEYVAFIHALESEHPDIMKLYDLTALTENGATWYDRTVWGIKISDGVGEEEDWYNDPAEEDVVIVGMHHAREWMSYMVPLYFATYLVETYGAPPIDNDMDGAVNEDPFNGLDDDGDGEDDDADNSTTARMDGLDNDGDGLIDEGIDEDGIEGLATYLVDHREIWIVPMVNPDGYVYDRTISEPGDGGGWRKNCRDQSVAGGKRSSGNGVFNTETDGVDLNRNYPYEWNRNEKGYVVDTDGVTVVSDSRNEWDGQYRGPDDDIDQDGDSIVGIDPISGNRIIDPDGVDEDYWNGRDDDGDGFIDEDRDGGFTEPETQALHEMMLRLDIYDPANDNGSYPDGYRPENRDGVSNVVTAISYHSYSALMIWPWGYTFKLSEHDQLFRYLGEHMGDITDYGNWRDEGGYKVSGEWGDWMYGSHGALSFTVELNTGAQGGFHPRPEMIIPTSRMLLGCNLYISEVANTARIARDTGASDLDVNAPEVVFTQSRNSIDEGERYPLSVNVENSENLAPGTVRVRYRVNGGKWKDAHLDADGKGRYVGSIPGQDGGSEVEFYLEADDVRGTSIQSYSEGYTYFSYDVKNSDEGVDASQLSIIAIVIIAIITLLVLRKR